MKKQTSKTTFDYSLHFGLNRVNPDCYDGWDGELYGCHKDARRMAALGGAKEATVLLDADCTAHNFRFQVRILSQIAQKGDNVLISYSGHGGSLFGFDSTEPDGRTETICLFDGEVIDDDIGALLRCFATGVNVLWISDSCHSATNARSVGLHKPKSRPYGVYPVINRLPSYRDAVMTIPNLTGISGCKDSESSYDGSDGGRFTVQFCSSMYDDFILGDIFKNTRSWCMRMDPRQTPQMTKYSGVALGRRKFPFQKL
jgi:metacaspase-1